MKVLVTGGAGYIGSHTCVALAQQGHEVVVVDNLINSQSMAIERVEGLVGKKIQFHEVDLLDRSALQGVFDSAQPEAVIHFAALKAVAESVAQPLRYYHNNLTGTLILCEVMREAGVRNIVFSSSATVYGVPEQTPIREDFPLGATNPYGRTKLMMEQILQDVYQSDPRWSVALLRYFNPIGAHPSGCIGEDPNGIPNNLVPYIAQVAVGKLPRLSVYGNDYPTPDGTGVRDYIHVMDVAEAHVFALEKLAHRPGVHIYNLGTGRGYSVLEVMVAFERASGKTIPYIVMPRRPGDVAISFADPTKAATELGWRATRDLDTMCADTWRWQSLNPNGYVEQ